MVRNIKHIVLLHPCHEISNPYIVLGQERPKTKGPLLFYFLRLYNFGFYERINQFWYSTHGSQK